MNKGLIIVSAGLVAVGIGVFTCALAAADFNISKLGTTNFQTTTHEFDKDINNLVINCKQADIIFKNSSDGKVNVTCKEYDKLKYKVTVKDDTLNIIDQDNRKWYDYIGIFSKSPSVTVYLPTRPFDNLNINNNTGDVTFENRWEDVTFENRWGWDNININLSTGDIYCNSSTKELNLKTTTGDIVIYGLYANNIDLSTTTGDIKASLITAHDSFNSKTTTGDVELEVINCKSLKSTGTTGDVFLGGVSAEDSMFIKRSTGDINFEKCEAKDVKIETSTGDVTGTFMSDMIVRATTTTGDINVPDTFEGGKCEVKTSTGDVNISIKK